MPQKRIYAFLIDFLISSVPTVLLMDLGIFVWKQSFETIIYPAAGILLLLLILKDIRRGQSPGKYFMGLGIENKTAKPINLILRNISLLVLPLDVFIFFLMDKRIGDVLFKTEVLVKEHTTMKRGTELMIGVFVSVLILYMSVTNLLGLYIRQKQEYIIMEAFVFGSKAIQEKTGEVIRTSTLPRYNLSRKDGKTKVRIETKVYGKKENADLVIFLEKKDDGEWVVEDYRYAVK